jgi:hypothetical protein
MFSRTSAELDGTFDDRHVMVLRRQVNGALFERLFMPRLY